MSVINNYNDPALKYGAIHNDQTIYLVKHPLIRNKNEMKRTKQIWLHRDDPNELIAILHQS